jgi:hypothetical protein
MLAVVRYANHASNLVVIMIMNNPAAGCKISRHKQTPFQLAMIIKAVTELAVAERDLKSLEAISFNVGRAFSCTLPCPIQVGDRSVEPALRQTNVFAMTSVEQPCPKEASDNWQNFQ